MPHQTNQEMPTLHDLIEVGSRYAEGLFAKKGALVPTYHAITADQSCLIIPMPPIEKDLALRIVRELFVAKDVVAYVFVDEAWTVLSNEEHLQVRPSEHPERREVVILSAESELEGALFARREIIRPDRHKPYLGPLEILPYKESKGRLVGMLARRTTLQ